MNTHIQRLQSHRPASALMLAGTAFLLTACTIKLEGMATPQIDCELDKIGWAFDLAAHDVPAANNKDRYFGNITVSCDGAGIPGISISVPIEGQSHTFGPSGQDGVIAVDYRFNMHGPIETGDDIQLTISFTDAQGVNGEATTVTPVVERSSG